MVFGQSLLSECARLYTPTSPLGASNGMRGNGALRGNGAQTYTEFCWGRTRRRVFSLYNSNNFSRNQLLSTTTKKQGPVVKYTVGDLVYLFQLPLDIGPDMLIILIQLQELGHPVYPTLS